MADLRSRPFSINFVEAFLPNKEVTFSWARYDEELMKEILKRNHFYVGFLIEYHYTDRVRDARMIGRYEVIFLVNVYLTDPYETGHRRVNSTSVGISHEIVE
jgi:hypothetical protein